jgi:hypothetical protein
MHPVATEMLVSVHRDQLLAAARHERLIRNARTAGRARTRIGSSLKALVGAANAGLAAPTPAVRPQG